MNKNPEYKARQIYDLEFPHWDCIDSKGECLAIYPDKLCRVFEAICKKFVFRTTRGKWADTTKCCVKYVARIHLNAPRTPVALRSILKKAGIMSTVTANQAEQGTRDEDGFYMVIGGEMIQLLGPAWVDVKKAKKDAGKRRLEELAEKVREDKRAAKKAKQDAKQDAKQEETVVVPPPPPPAPEPKVHPDHGKWAIELSLYVNTQTKNMIDILVIGEEQKDVQARDLYTDMLLNGAYAFLDWKTPSYQGPIHSSDIPDLDPNGTGHIDMNILRSLSHLRECKKTLEYVPDDQPRARLHILDIPRIELEKKRRASMGGEQTEREMVWLWNTVVMVKKKGVPQDNLPEMKHKMIIFANEGHLPDPEKYPGISLRLWEVKEQKLKAMYRPGFLGHEKK